MYRGVDVSSYQGRIDWKKAEKAGVDFSILKVIRRDLKADKQFENNWAGCVEAGVPIQGVYNYATLSSGKFKKGRITQKALPPTKGREGRTSVQPGISPTKLYLIFTCCIFSPSTV